MPKSVEFFVEIVRTVTTIVFQEAQRGEAPKDYKSPWAFISLF